MVYAFKYRATFGTTKYCSFFLRNVTCNNPGCLYLHALARESDCFTKEDLQHDFQLDEFDMDHTRLENVSPVRQTPCAPTARSVLAVSPASSAAADTARLASVSSVCSDQDQKVSNGQMSMPASLESMVSAPDPSHPFAVGAATTTNVFTPVETAPSATRPFSRSSTQSRRSFAVAEDLEAASLLPGITALGLGKADSVCCADPV